MFANQKDLTTVKNMRNFDYNDIKRYAMGDQYMRFYKAKIEYPHLNQQELCKKINISSSTLNRIRRDLDISSPYRYNVPLHKQIRTKRGETEEKNFEQNTTKVSNQSVKRRSSKKRSIPKDKIAAGDIYEDDKEDDINEEVNENYLNKLIS